jgi:hypothetical protein
LQLFNRKKISFCKHGYSVVYINNIYATELLKNTYNMKRRAPSQFIITNIYNSMISNKWKYSKNYIKFEAHTRSLIDGISTLTAISLIKDKNKYIPITVLTGTEVEIISRSHKITQYEKDHFLQGVK